MAGPASDRRIEAVGAPADRRGQSVYAVLDAIAARQHGIVARAQLVGAGISRHLIDHRIRTGLLRIVHAGVYRVGPVHGARAREMAAVLACRAAVVSHRSAAALREWLHAQNLGEAVDVTLRGNGQRGRRPGIRAHRTQLAEDEVSRLDTIELATDPPGAGQDARAAGAGVMRVRP